jgi:hypothetical protein
MKIPYSQGACVKKSLLIVIGALFIPYVSVTNGATLPSPASQVADAISSVRARYATINKSLRKYKTVKRELSGFSTEGGEAVAYFDGKAIMKIATTHLGETGRAFEDFYYWDEKLIFVYRKREAYDKPFSAKVISTTENRFYFSDDKLIRWIDENAKQVAPGGSEYQEQQDTYLRASQQLVEGARSRKTVIEAPDNP